VGSEEVLKTLREICRQCPVRFRTFVVQPGVSAARVSRPQLDLLGATETYLHETYQIPLFLIASP
jgi:hypothetical protein